MHVAQEVKGEQTTVLESVLDCDVERKELLERERELLRRAEEGVGPGEARRRVRARRPRSWRGCVDR